MKTHLILFFILFIFLIITLFIIFKNNDKENYRMKMIVTENDLQQESIDNRKIFIWTFWEGTPSELVDICLKRIDKSCQEGSDEKVSYVHIHLTNDNLRKYLEDIDSYECYAN